VTEKVQLRHPGIARELNKTPTWEQQKIRTTRPLGSTVKTGEENVKTKKAPNARERSSCKQVARILGRERSLGVAESHLKKEQRNYQRRMKGGDKQKKTEKKGRTAYPNIFRTGLSGCSSKCPIRKANLTWGSSSAKKLARTQRGGRWNQGSKISKKSRGKRNEVQDAGGTDNPGKNSMVKSMKVEKKKRTFAKKNHIAVKANATPVKKANALAK